MTPQPRIAVLVTCCLGALAAIILLNRLGDSAPRTAPTAAPATALGRSGPATARDDSERLQARLLREQFDRLLSADDARSGEAIVAFTDTAALQRFLQRAAANGFEVLGRLDRLNAVRLRYGSRDALWDDLRAHAPDYADVGANTYAHIPGIPPAEARAAVRQVPFGSTALAFLGIAGDNSGWGRGVTIAVIDSGVAAEGVFGSRLRTLDLGLGTTPGTGETAGHGTAVAALAAGADANGVAPSASVLGIRVTGADGLSDTFTVAQAIIAAADAGAQVINISLGAYAGSTLLANAIGYALERGAVITSSAGNDQAAQLTWPAADPRVISVGAVDALGQQVTFSNTGAQLKVVAPGFELETAWLDGHQVLISGTSASAPLVAGAIAAVMSETPGLTAQQAWQLLQDHSSEAGVAGVDPAYGHGVLNLGWTMNRADLATVDTAVASLYFDDAAGELVVVAQNRSAQGVAGLQLDISSDGGVVSRQLPWLPAGKTTTVTIPVSAAQLEKSGVVGYQAVLTNPAGLTDREPANNRRSTLLRAPTPEG